MTLWWWRCPTADAVAHRVVPDGARYSAPVRIDAEVRADLKTYIPLAPLHQPFALEAIEILLCEQPDLPQVACFDTAFHHSLPQFEKMLPLPNAAWERGLRRYGFNGLSYEYMLWRWPSALARPRKARPSSPIPAVAQACAPCRVCRAWRRPWAFRRWTA